MHTWIICLKEIPCVGEEHLPTLAIEKSSDFRDWFHSAPPSTLPEFPPVQVLDLYIAHLLARCPGKYAFWFMDSWNVMRIKEGTKRSFQIMDNIIHAGHILRKLMVEKRTVCETIAGNWKEWFSAMLASICRSKLGSGILHMMTQLLGSPRAVGIIDRE